ncbi:MAG TPA: hypothetical protein DIV86_05100 [Alphaproteobacteria bacterium]|nr:hypothetical protein [Alphaproteobacteria bacterium]
MKKQEYLDPSMTDIFGELRHIKNYDTLMSFFDIMPLWVDIVLSLGIFGVFYGMWVLLMGILTDNDE